MKRPKIRQSLKSNKAISLVALVVTIIVILILASITLKVLIREDGITSTTKSAKEQAEINSELQIVVLSSNEASKKDKYGDVQQKALEDALDHNAGKGKTTVELYEKGDLYFVTFKKSGRKYEVTTTGYTKYVGKGENAAIIIAQPKKSLTPNKEYEVKLLIKTVKENNIDEIEYAWSNSEDDQPESEDFSKKTVEADEQDETNTEKKTVVRTKENIEDGEYYLWVKVTLGDEEIVEHFGPFIIGENEIKLAVGELEVNPNGGRWKGSTEKQIIKDKQKGEKIILEDAEHDPYTVTFSAENASVSYNSTIATVIFDKWVLQGSGVLNGNEYTFKSKSGSVTATYTVNEVELPEATKMGCTFLI